MMGFGGGGCVMGSQGQTGFREVLVDQPFTGKWMEVDMNLGGGHSTFQGTKFSDWAGGFSYKTSKSSCKGTTAHRSIYWRTLNDTLELTEISLHVNLVDNQVRYIFQGSPIVGPITIQETPTNIIILVATLTSVNRFIFTHPTRLENTTGGDFNNKNKPSIFHQICNPPQMNFRSFNLYEHAMNIPVPLSATCSYVEQRGRNTSFNDFVVPSSSSGECLFAFSFDSGSINVYKISRDDILLMYDLRQANLFTRLFSGLTTSIMRAPTAALDAVIGLNFFFSKGERTGGVHLVTLSMNGQLNLWSCSNLANFTEWNSYHCGVVDNRFAVDNFTDSCMLLRKSEEHHHPNGYPTFVIYIPGDGFRVYKIQKGSSTVGNAGAVTPSKYQLSFKQRVEFVERELMDFCVTPDHLFTLVNNPEEETEWLISSYPLEDGDSHSPPNRVRNPSFIPALLEPLPVPDVDPSPYSEAKEFYMALIFSNSSFTAATITKALTMFRKEEDDPVRDKDWESLRITAMNMIDREIALETSDSEFEISDEDYTELSHKFWKMFYNSCVEYHIHTVKPLGLFFETNSKMVCVIKKSRISFLRPTDFLETLYYFPSALNLSTTVDPEEEDDEMHKEMLWVSKYLGVIQSLEDVLNENHLAKIHKRLRENVTQLQEVCKEITQFLVSTDPHCFVTIERQLVQILGIKLKELGRNAESAMKLTLDLVSTWEQADGPSEMEEENQPGMTSRLGAHITYRILQQLMQHRFTISRGTMLLQYMITSFFSKNQESDGYPAFSVSWVDNDDAKKATVAYFALLDVINDFVEPVPPFIRERGLKVANILKLATSDTSMSISTDDIESLWPTRILEGFCLSTVGFLSIMSRVGGSSSISPVLRHAQAAGRCIWTNGIEDRSRPLEDYLIISCQYNILLKYANYMVDYFINKAPMKHFYLGLCHLCLFNEDIGLNHLRIISFDDIFEDDCFCIKVLQLPQPIQTPVSLFNTFYVRVISILQVLEYLPGVQQMAAAGLQVAESEEEAIKMCALAFKCALQLDDYDQAYDYLLKMPSTELGPQEKLASLRTFVGHLVREGEMETLLNLNMDQLFSKSSSVRDQVETILFAQANLADPLEQSGVYQMLYDYHLTKDNFHKAAATVYYKAMRIGDKATGVEALHAQKECYLNVVACLSLIEPESCRNVIKKTGFVRQEPLPQIHCFDPESLGDEVFPVICLPRDKELVVLSEKDIKKEMFLLIMLCKLEDDKPVKPTDFERRAAKTVDQLALHHRYDDALKLCSLWDLDPAPVISYITDVCCNLVYNINPQGGDPALYFIHNNISDLAISGGTGCTELGFRLLEKYLNKVEKPKESCLHQNVTLKLLAAEVELPQWLLSSYKKRNVRQLLQCLIRYGEWEKGTELALKVLDAALGRVRADEFDFTVKKISSYDPIEPGVLPLDDMNHLACLLLEHGEKNPVLIEYYTALKERTSLFCDRVIDCSKERSGMFAMDRK